MTLPLGNFDRYEPFSVALWLKTPDVKDRAVILHRSMSWTDAGSRGYQLLIEDGKLSVGLIHFWPGNALAIKAIDPLPLDQWAHVVIAYDGSSRSSGLALYVDGRRASVDVVRDQLTKTITGGGNDQITIGQRFRDRGFKNGLVDEIKVFDRAMTPLEAAQLHGGSAPQRNSGSPAKLTADERRDLLAYYLAAVDPEYQKLLAALKDLRKKQCALVDPVAEIMVMKELPSSAADIPAQTWFLRRTGGARQAGHSGESTAVHRLSPAATRLGLAQWLTDPKHPLTARVAVNRIWQGLFGRGIVATPEDFGSQGQLPSHPELLDWMARTFVEDGWDAKKLVRLIVTSATYRQSSEASPEVARQGP